MGRRTSISSLLMRIMRDERAKRGPTRGLSAEDARLWRQLTEQVTPLEGRDFVEPTADDVASPEKPPIISRRLPVYAPEPPSRKPTTEPPMTHGAGPGLDRRTAIRMRRGKVEIEGRIDLHGLTLLEAERAFHAFLMASYAQGRRSVLVITGKGTRLDGRIGLIRQAVPEWLNISPLREITRGFSYAAPKDGGEGALYVMLKRSKGDQR